MNRGGVLVYSRRYPKYSRLTLPWIPLNTRAVKLFFTFFACHLKVGQEDYVGT